MGKRLNTQEAKIESLVSGLKLSLSELGYKTSTIERLGAVWSKLIAYCDQQQVTLLTAEISREFSLKQYGSILGDKDASHNVSRAMHMLLDFQNFGMVFKQSSATIKGFSTKFKTLFEGFLEHLRKTGTAEGSIATWKSRLFRFEYFLNNIEITEFEQIQREHIYTYVESLTCFSSGNIGATIRTLRRLFDYAIQSGNHCENPVNVLPDVRRIKKYRLPNTFNVDEVEKILGTVDRENPFGKRNYAIMLIVAKLGVRIGDVRSLRFENIDWQNKIISIVQQKTGVVLDLPLLDDVGWAIIDYLEHGRPQTDCPSIFVRHLAPYDEFKDSLHRVVLKHVQKAGIKTPANKPIGMHTFRHSIATTMMKNGEKYTDIAQVLGHATPESAEAYISLDIEQLRQCALEVNFV